MRRAALYVRVSTDLQEREQTIQSQLAAITRYADQNGLHHSPALTYSDDGYTGTPYIPHESKAFLADFHG